VGFVVITFKIEEEYLGLDICIDIYVYHSGHDNNEIKITMTVLLLCNLFGLAAVMLMIQ
jgi:hypothetical protein